MGGVGDSVGVGAMVGALVGVGAIVGALVGVGATVGALVGVGAIVGLPVGANVGCAGTHSTGSNDTSKHEHKHEHADPSLALMHVSDSQPNEPPPYG